MKTEKICTRNRLLSLSGIPLNILERIALSGLMLFAADLRAADLVWTNTAGGAWSTASNWDPNQVPVATDNAYITASGTYTVTVNASATVFALTLGGNTGTQTLSVAGGTFAINGAGVGGSLAIVSLSGGTLAGPGILTLAGPLNWTGGTISGSVQCNGGALGGVSYNSMNLAGGQLINTGQLTVNAAYASSFYTGSDLGFCRRHRHPVL